MTTRNIQRPAAPDSLAVFLYLKHGTPAPVYGRVERRNTRPPYGGNRPGATVCALVETRLPATNWNLPTTKNIQEASGHDFISSQSSFRAVRNHFPRHSSADWRNLGFVLLNSSDQPPYPLISSRVVQGAEDRANSNAPLPSRHALPEITLPSGAHQPPAGAHASPKVQRSVRSKSTHSVRPRNTTLQGSHRLTTAASLRVNGGY